MSTGLLAYPIVALLFGQAVPSRQNSEAQGAQSVAPGTDIASADSAQAPRIRVEPIADTSNLPYDEAADAQSLVAAARAAAHATNKYLMITFGANWCVDCRNLDRILKSDEVVDYTRDRFLFVNVDVGKFNQNTEVAAALGVDLSRGIPVAIFYDPTGAVIGSTSAGQLEPARRYTSKQILGFIRDIAERGKITTPDLARE